MSAYISTELEHDWKRDPNQRNLVAISLILMILTIASIAWVLFAAREWAPLGPYPEQIILSIDTGSATVTVAGEKCANEDVQIFGTWSLVAIDPPGLIIPLGDGGNFRPEGCHPVNAINVLPLEFLEDEALRDRIWIFTGTETPTDGTRVGIPAVWQTQPFTYEDMTNGS
jgi:hypothetical protein